MADTKPTTQKFSKGERSIPHHSQKASKYYPAEDVAVPKKVRSQTKQHGRIGKVKEEEDAGASQQHHPCDCKGRERQDRTTFMLQDAYNGPSLTCIQGP